MDADKKKTTLRMIPYGLYVLTADDGNLIGSGTVNWVSQMAFDPPLVAIGVKKDSATFEAISNGAKIGLSFLESGQGDLAFAFFGSAETDGSEFVTKDKRIPFSRTDNGAIVLDDVPAWAELTVVEINATGDHAVVVAEVIDVGLNSDNPDILTLKELGLNYGG